MVPVAPALFSMMKEPPKRSCNLGASVLAIRSVEPPGGNGTTNETGLSGHAKALLMPMAVTKPNTIFLNVISISFLFK
jgi:hypothetical protein